MTAETHPLVEQLMRDAAPRAATPLAGRERTSEAICAAAMLAAAGVLLAVAPAPEQTVGVGTAAALVVLCAIAFRVDFRVGAGSTTGVQLVAVPMLVLLPPGAVPLLVALALVLHRVPEYVRGTTHPDRVLLHLSDAWFVVAPAAVLAVADPGPPALEHWPVYLVALAAQLVADAAISVLREWRASEVPPAVQLRMMSLVAYVDAALAPIGLLVGIAAYDEPVALVVVGPLLGLLAGFAHERDHRIENALELSSAYRGSALLVGEMLELEDPYTGGEHSRGVVALALAVGERLRLDAREQGRLEFTALLHDIGKLKVPRAILDKPGPLTAGEWEVVRRHPEDGQRMLEQIGGVLAEVGLAVRAHHERWDGAGYPDGLTGEAIPFIARIVTVCDSYNAMTTTRPYRTAMSAETALTELRECAGTQFDPRVVDALAELVAVRAPTRVSAALAG